MTLKGPSQTTFMMEDTSGQMGRWEATNDNLANLDEVMQHDDEEGGGLKHPMRTKKWQPVKRQDVQLMLVKGVTGEASPKMSTPIR